MAWSGLTPMMPATPMSMTTVAATTPAIAPSSVLRELIDSKKGCLPIRLPISRAAASQATTARTVKSVQTRPFGFDV